MPRGLAAPIAPLLHRKLICLPPSALGGADGPEEEQEIKLTRETEPDEFWQTKSEAKGENPAKDPLAIIGVLGILLPFIILGIAIATGYVDVGNYRYGRH
jgi:hypothetical protein